MLCEKEACRLVQLSGILLPSVTINIHSIIPWPTRVFNKLPCVFGAGPRSRIVRKHACYKPFDLEGSAKLRTQILFHHVQVFFLSFIAPPSGLLAKDLVGTDSESEQVTLFVVCQTLGLTTSRYRLSELVPILALPKSITRPCVG